MAAFYIGIGGSYAGLEKGAHLMDKKPEGENHEIATLAGGCFWCLESELRAVDGVLFTEVGYTGGDTQNPGYKQITTGKTGHAEAVQVYYNPEVISYGELLDFFFTRAHDPTQLNRQGVDVGTQYRSAIFYHDDEQKRTAEVHKTRLNAEVFSGKIVTEIAPLETFWPGEEYHQQYYEKYEDEHGQPHIRVLLKKKKDDLLAIGE